MKNSYRNKLFLFICSGCGLGLLPIAPGTWGTLLGVLIHISVVFLLPPHLKMPVMVSSFLLVCILNILLAPWAERYWASTDPKRFVIDEVAGYMVIPLLFHSGSLWQIVVYGFILFRIFDIIKVPPADIVEKRLKAGWAILLDDIVSGVYAVGVIYILLHLGVIR
ncbi:MAG: phosphatidylglycerophosphatase A [Nitrospirae bacterium]|nr:MAG: phosphatidylglycerophosphatase A [Nitrospirota bacterium]